MTTDMLTLDEATHTYRVGGREILSVTQILVAAGLCDTKWLTEEALKRGTYVHQTIELHVQGELDEGDLHSTLRGHLLGWKKFERDTGFKVIRDVQGRWQSEIRRHHPLYGYAGTIDHLGEMRGRPVLVDLKSGDPDDWHMEQLALYAMTFDFPVGSKRPDRLNVYTREDGNYRLVERKDRADFENAKAAITVARLRLARGLTDGRKTA